jgi:hypothetical protein
MSRLFEIMYLYATIETFSIFLALKVDTGSPHQPGYQSNWQGTTGDRLLMECRVDVTSMTRSLFVTEVTLNSFIKLSSEIKTLSKRCKCQCWELYIHITAYLLEQHYNNIVVNVIVTNNLFLMLYKSLEICENYCLLTIRFLLEYSVSYGR